MGWFTSTQLGVRLSEFKSCFLCAFGLCTVAAPYSYSFPLTGETTSPVRCENSEVIYVMPKMCWDKMVFVVVAVHIFLARHSRPAMLCCTLGFQPHFLGLRL